MLATMPCFHSLSLLIHMQVRVYEQVMLKTFTFEHVYLSFMGSDRKDLLMPYLPKKSPCTDGIVTLVTARTKFNSALWPLLKLVERLERHEG